LHNPRQTNCTYMIHTQACGHICYIKAEKCNSGGKGRIPLEARGHRSTLRLVRARHVAVYVERIKFALL
jgi:hypothetical protein